MEKERKEETSSLENQPKPSSLSPFSLFPIGPLSFSARERPSSSRRALLPPLLFDRQLDPTFALTDTWGPRVSAHPFSFLLSLFVAEEDTSTGRIKPENPGFLAFLHKPRPYKSPTPLP